MKKHSERSRYWQEGYSKQKCGYSTRSCPYNEFDEGYEEWNEGWSWALEEMSEEFDEDFPLDF